MTPLDKGLARRRDTYVKTHKKHIFMHLAEFKPAVPETNRPQIMALDISEIGNQLITKFVPSQEDKFHPIT
jgi:hypothetical protein